MNSQTAPYTLAKVRRSPRWYSVGPWTRAKALRAAGVTVATTAAGTALAWAGGFDFDARTPEVAAYCLVIACAAAVAVLLACSD